MDKRTMTIMTVAAIVIIGIVVGWYFVASNSAKKCVAPNDALVDCELLRQNPTKTDWPGDE